MNKIWLFLASSILQGATVSISEPSYWRYAHSDAKVLAGVEWKRIANTPAGVALRAVAGSAEIPGLSVTSLLEQIDRLLISSPGGANAKLNKQAPVLIIATGHFDLPQLRKLAITERGTLKQYKNAEFIYPPEYKAADSIVALIDSQTILIGEKPVVAAAIDKARIVYGPLSSFNRIFARANASAGDHDLWLIASVSPSEFFTAPGPQTPFLSDILSADMAVDFHEGLGLGFRLATKSVESARGMAGAMKMMSALAGGDMREIMRAVEIRDEASDVKISMKIDQASLQKSIQQAVAMVTKPQAPIDLGGFKQLPAMEEPSIRQVVPVDVQALSRPAVFMPQAPPPPPKNLVIRIEGLEGGIREIPYTQPATN